MLKCSITSQFDFFAGVYTAGGEMWGGGMGTSIDIWAVRVWRNDADLRVMPDFRDTKSCCNNNFDLSIKKNGDNETHYISTFMHATER